VTDLQRTGRAAAVALLAGLVLAGCSGTASTSSRPDTPTSSVTPQSEAPSPGATSSEESAEPVELPWPAAGAADAAALQAAVDNGSQPWLLDPSEVAISYASAAHGWTDTEAYPGPDGTSVDIRNSDGERLTLTLAQPGRTGDDGIWVVTAERPS
jgi:ABC-type glycerol-3-phosphate transport system substrate-binding protein